MANTNQTNIPTLSQQTINDIADDIDCAVSILRELLQLANEQTSVAVEGNYANSVIHAATRYVGDISALSHNLHSYRNAMKAGA